MSHHPHRQSILSEKLIVDFNNKIHQPPFQCPFHASDIERYSRLAFPILFLSFHLVYWTLLISVSEVNIVSNVLLIHNNIDSVLDSGRRTGAFKTANIVIVVYHVLKMC